MVVRTVAAGTAATVEPVALVGVLATALPVLKTAAVARGRALLGTVMTGPVMAEAAMTVAAAETEVVTVGMTVVLTVGGPLVRTVGATNVGTVDATAPGATANR